MLIRENHVEMETPEEAACVWAAWSDGRKENYISCVPDPEFSLVWEAVKPEIDKPVFVWNPKLPDFFSPTYLVKWEGKREGLDAISANALTIGKDIGFLKNLFELTKKE